MVGFDCKVEIHMNYFSIFTNIVCFNNFATPVQDFVGFDGQVFILLLIKINEFEFLNHSLKTAEL